MKQLNNNQLAFCEEYVKNGFNGAKAYRNVYEQENKQVCASEAYKMLRDPRIQEEINNVLLSFRVVGFEVGIDRKTIMTAIKNMLAATKPVYKNNNKEGTVDLVGEHPDWQAINNAINTYAKLTGDFATEKKDVLVTGVVGTEDVKNMTPEERREYKDALLREL